MENGSSGAVLAAQDRLTRRRLAVAIGVLPTFGFLFPGAASASNTAELFKEAAPGSAEAVDHSPWDRLLKAYVKPGADGLNRVDYAAFKSGGREALSAYIADLQVVAPGALDRPEQFAFFANLYNAKTIAIVLEKYPVKSIKDVSLGGGLLALVSGGPWEAKVLKVKGIDLSLDDIEHGILRPLFKDPRVHYAINCASVGCPNLQTDAFSGAKLDAQLNAAARAYVNHPRGVSAGPSGVVLSSIYRWFKTDFGGDDAGVLSHLRKYAAPALLKKLESITAIDSYSYDWSLNDFSS